LTKTTTFRIDEGFKFEMKQAIKNGIAVNMTDLIRKAVREYIQNHMEPLDVLREAFQRGDVDQ
jgi:Arc/MetJ-type ribon-helix-helix transcriptional regulator